MSTYLVAFVVSKMASTERKETQAVYAAPTFIEEGWANYALEICIKTLKAIENYTEIPFSISKVDHVGLPNDYFLSGSMENWGLLTVR